MADSPKETLAKLLNSMTHNTASDLHLKVGYPPSFRIRGLLRSAKMDPLPDTAHIEKMLEGLVPASRQGEYEKVGALDFSATGATGDRYRINIFRATGDMHVSIRRVQSEIPSFESLQLPAVYRETAARCIDGLILVSGVTGSGKSSTLASMLQHINEIRSMHIITIEDPVEFVFKPVKSIISQREIGVDVPTYRDALKSVVRQDPDCILIGEMRDRETMVAGIQAAETGHLVLGSLHVSDVQQTFSRILEFFPQSEHPFVRASIASSLRAIMCQRLLPGIDEGTRFPATEVLLNNSIVKDKILRGLDADLPGLIAKSREEGMRSFTDSLKELVEEEKVHYDTAMEYAPNRDALAAAVKGISSA